MKKTIAILLVLAFVMTGIFAAESVDTATVTLNSKVDGDFLFGVSKTKPATYSSLAAAQADNPYSDSVAFENAFEQPSTIYVGYVTNNLYKMQPSIVIEATPFYHKSNSRLKVGYTMSVNGEETEVHTYESMVSNTLDFKKLVETGLRQEDMELTFTANADEVDMATAGDYTATITFKFRSNG